MKQQTRNALAVAIVLAGVLLLRCDAVAQSCAPRPVPVTELMADTLPVVTNHQVMVMEHDAQRLENVPGRAKDWKDVFPHNKALMSAEQYQLTLPIRIAVRNRKSNR